jgi:hypothetical protein
MIKNNEYQGLCYCGRDKDGNKTQNRVAPIPVSVNINTIKFYCHPNG